MGKKEQKQRASERSRQTTAAERPAIDPHHKARPHIKNAQFPTVPKLMLMNEKQTL